jgi:hypothetical protein
VRDIVNDKRPTTQVKPFTQDADDWLDLTDYQDVCARTGGPEQSGAAAVPIAPRLRWRLAGPSGTWDATFRVRVPADSPET